MSVKGKYLVVELNDSDFSEPIMKKFGVRYQAQAGQFGQDPDYTVRLNCWMSNLNGQVLLPVLRSTVTGSGFDGRYEVEDAEKLKDKMDTLEFWTPIIAELQQQHKAIVAEEFAKLLTQAEYTMRSIDAALRDDQQEVEVVVKVRVKAENVAALALIPPHILGFTFDNLDSTLGSWMHYKNLGFTDEQAGALALWARAEAKEREIKLLKSER